MRKTRSLPLGSFAAALIAMSSLVTHAQLSDVTQPGDPIVPSSNNTPGSEGVANAIDNQPTKYLNFDRLNTGFTVTPRVGLSVVQCLTLTSANDAPERDPASYALEGSYNGSNFTMIASGSVGPFTNRFQKQTYRFENNTPYLAYRLIFPTVLGPGGNSMQIAEVELLGFLAPTDVTQPGDPIVPSSNNTPGSEGVANAIDNQPTKYLNFDRLNTGLTVTPSVGATLVSGITLTSANDAPERDPASYTLEGTLDGTSFFPIAAGPVPAFPTRFLKNYIFFPNDRAFRAYRLIFPTVLGPGGNSMQIAEVELLGDVADLAQDITLPGDPIIPSSNNTPGSEGVANAIDNQPTKYLNFDRLNTGFTVNPGARGLTVVSGLTLTSANDAPERDPASYLLSGSYDGSNFTQIATGPVAAFTNRFQKQTLLFAHKVPYLQYRLIFPTVLGPGGNSMQISEVEILGVLADTDVTTPGDPVVASSNNTPGSEGVANAIDNQPTKYLNFDRLNTGLTVTPRVGGTILVGLSLTSANDAPERDPASYVLTGSEDGSNFVAISSGPVPPFPTRFFKSYIFFPDNTKEFAAYRLIFPTVLGPGGNSMQIAEVEFLGHQRGGGSCTTETNGILIRRQPLETPVLLGSTATFRVGLTGPWKVQWFRNGQPIPGANNASYTTPVAAGTNDGDRYMAKVGPASVGGVRGLCETSDEVMLNIFSPSATESIALSWQGSGANGAPTAMLPTDITGFQPQAYWNNLTGGSGNLSPVLNSANLNHSTITVTWATSGEWGVGTGNGDPTERMLNGMATSFSTDPNSPQTVTLSGVPAGNHSLFLYSVQVPQEFFNMDFRVVTHDGGGADIVQSRFIRPLNSDEYNPSPGFSLVTADTAANRGVGNMLRFDNLQPGPDGIIEVRFHSPGRVDLPGGDPIRGPGLNGLQLVLNPAPAGAPPVITRQPVSANAIVGGQVTLVVEATGPGLSYQWLRNGQTIAGATAAQLTLSNLQLSDVGNYTVVVSNPAGRVGSRTAVVGVVASAQLNFGLISYFKLDGGEPDGLTASNAAAGGQNGRIQGAVPSFPAGQIGNALSLNGADNYVVAPNYPKVSRAITVAGWVQPFAPGPLVNNWVEGQTTGASGQFLMDLVDDNGVLTVRAQIEVGPNRVLATAGLTSEQSDSFVWHHFAMSANGVTLSIYWDGQLLATVDYLGSINATPAIPWLAIGESLDSAMGPAGTPFFGNLDDIALWNRSLSDIELLGAYNGGLAGLMLSEIAPVLNINRSPLASDDSTTTPQGTPVTINVLANDSDPDAGDVLSVTSTTVPAHGTAVITNNLVAYTPNAGYAGPDSFSYSIGDGHGGIASAVVRITVTANLPVITCPANLTVECTGGLTPASYTVTAMNAAGAPLPVTCVPPSGTGFRVGTSNVTCTATDTAGNSSGCGFTVTVVDTVPPVVNCPGNIDAQGTSADGAVVTYIASASDPCGIATFDCSPPAGNTFPIGVTTVTCRATDGAGNSNSCSFQVTVRATTPPVITCPASVSAECAGSLTPVTFSATAVDSTGAAVPVVCVPPSGTGFRVGTSNVTCTATDSAGGSSRCTFTVTVVDTTPPRVTCPGDMTVAATGNQGAVVNYIASASDPCGIADFNCTPPPGSVFPLGMTTVACVASDPAGNVGRCTFKVTVRSPNECPTPRAIVAPLCAVSGQPGILVISANGSNACVALDGSMSVDPDGDMLTFSWFEGSHLIATGPVVTNCFGFGEHWITLMVDDGRCLESAMVHFEIGSACDAVEVLIGEVNNSALSRKEKRPLIAALKKSCADFERGKAKNGIKKLEEFIKKLKKVAKQDPALAAAFEAKAQAVIDAANCSFDLDEKMRSHSKDKSDSHSHSKP